MRPSRTFRPLAVVPLEDRAVPSHAVHHAGASMRRAPLGQPSSSSPLDLDPASWTPAVSAAVGAGLTVSERWTPANQPLTDPHNGTQITTTTAVVTIPGAASPETVVDVQTTAGNTTDHDIATRSAAGLIQTENSSEVRQGNTTSFNKTIQTTGLAGIKLVQGTTVLRGATTTTTETITAPDNSVVHEQVVSTHRGNRDVVQTITTLPDGTVQRLHTVVVHQGPASLTIASTGGHPRVPHGRR